MRNNRESLFSSSQRLTDVSKAVRAKSQYCLSKLNGEDITPFLRRIEKKHKLDFANMKPRNWFFEGSTFISPNWKQQGKPFQINRDIKQEWLNSLPKPKVLTLKDKLKAWLHPTETAIETRKKNKPLSPENLENNQESFF